ncbi:Pilus assembly protein [Pararobbsia alpina]|uniref:hypothetical protein n=1 Tax=Pararobbsia alpina TaxID=621374 RepID=UPI0039A5A706
MKTIRVLIRSMLCVTGLATLLSLGGCLTSTPQWDANFGNAVTAMRTMQTANPDASMNDNPVVGLDGEAAGYAIENYGKSFDAPPPHVNLFTVGVGSSGSN